MKITTIYAGVILAMAFVLTSVAQAENDHELYGNIGLASNYVWRGVTQTGDQAAIQGGIDYQHSQGIYAGTWVSNVAGGYEQDWYGGYGFATGPVTWDVGYILYTYPVQSNLTFGEAYANVTWEWLNGGLALTLNADDDPANPADSGDVFLYVGGSWELRGLDLGATVGHYSRGRTGIDNYSYVELFLSKDDFKFAFDNNTLDGTDGDYRFWLSYSKNFNLM